MKRVLLPRTVDKGASAALPASSASVMYVSVHSLGLLLGALHLHPSRRSVRKFRRYVQIMVFLVGLSTVSSFYALAQAPRRGRTLKGHSNFVSALGFSKNGKLLASASSDGTLRLWNADTGKLLHGIALDDAMLAAGIVLSPDGGALLAAVGQEVRAWNTKDAKEAWRRDVKSAVRAVAISPAGDLVAAGGEGIVLLAAESGDVRNTLAAGAVSALAFAPAGPLLAVASVQGEVSLWNRQTGKPEKTLGRGSAVSSLSFSVDGKFLAVGREDSQLRVYDVESGAERWSQPELASGTTVAVTGRWVVGGAGSDKLQAWDLTAGHALWWVKGSGSEIHVLAVAQDGKRMATGGPDGTIILWGR